MELEKENKNNDKNAPVIWGLNLRQMWFHSTVMCIFSALIEAISICKSIPSGFNLQKDNIGPYLENNGWFHCFPLIISLILASYIADFYFEKGKRDVARFFLPPALVFLLSGIFRAFFIIIILKFFNQ